MCLEVRNLFSDKDVILSKEDILKVVKYAIDEKVVSVSVVTFLTHKDIVEDITDGDYIVELKERDAIGA